MSQTKKDSKAKKKSAESQIYFAYLSLVTQGYASSDLTKGQLPGLCFIGQDSYNRSSSHFLVQKVHCNHDW